MVPKIRAMRRENIDRRQVRGNFRGCFLGGKGGAEAGGEAAGRDGAGGTRRQQKADREKRPDSLSRRESLPPVYASTRASPLTKEQNRMIPRFSGIRHVFDTRAKTYLPICGSRGARRRRNCNAFGPYTRPTPGKGPHEPRNTPLELYRTPGDAAKASRFCSYIRSSPIRNR